MRSRERAAVGIRASRIQAANLRISDGRIKFAPCKPVSMHTRRSFASLHRPLGSLVGTSSSTGLR